MIHPDFIRMFTSHGECIISRREWESTRIKLPIYTRNGSRKTVVARTAEERKQASYGVHRANLFPTLKEAIANRERIYREMEARP